MHSLLTRQLKQSGLTHFVGRPDAAVWVALLGRVSQSYADSDQERYLLERSLEISSREMQELSGSLRAERDRLTAILHSLGDGLCALDSQGRLLLINPQGEQMLGWLEAELAGRDLLTTVGASWANEAPDIEPMSLP